MLDSHPTRKAKTSLEIDAVCRLVAAGREASRQLAKDVKRLGLSEAEFRLLWQLRTIRTRHNGTPPDQTELASLLGLSAAQVSSVVDRLRNQGYIIGMPAPGDRRKQVWQIGSTGFDLIESYLQQSVSKFEENSMHIHSKLPGEDAA